MQIAVRVTLASTSPVPTYTGGPFVSGVAQLSSSVVTGWDRTYLAGMGPCGERADIVKGGNYGQLLDSILSISNHGQWYAAFQAAGGALDGALVELGEATGPTTMTTRWTGSIVDPMFEGMNIECRVENVLGVRHKLVPARALSGQEFPGLPGDKEGLPVPILYGAPSRMTSPPIQSERDYLAALRMTTGSNPEAIYRSSTMIAQPYGGAAPTLTLVPVVFDLLTGVTDYVPPDDYTATPWWLSSGNVYMEIYEGAGSGQTRKIAAAPGIGYATIGSDFFTWSNVELASPLDTLPDATSGIRFYAEANGAVLVVADEAATESVIVEIDGTTYPIGFSSGAVEGVVTADVSAEFTNGEDYAALVYIRPSNDYGNAALSDGLTASGGTSASVLPFASGASPTFPYGYYDALCHAEIYTQDLPDSVLSESPTVYMMHSITTAADFSYEIVVLGERWTNDVDVLSPFVAFPLDSTSRSTYTSAIFPDGTPGNFAAFAVPLDSLPVPLRSYRRLKFGICLYDGASIPATYFGAATWTNGATSVVVDAASAATAVGRRIRPYQAVLVADPFNDTILDSPRPGSPAVGESYGGNAEDWRTVTAVTPLGGTFYRLDFATPIALATADYYTIAADAADFVTVTERESGLAFSFGAIPQDSQFLVSTSSGRTFSTAWPALPAGASIGDPITLARDAALDMYYRDLGLGSNEVDFTSFQALPADPITSAMVARTDSAQRVADLCQQFNWVVAHDSSGKEYATAWLSRVGTTAYDFSIDTDDVVQGSLTGVAISDIQDLVNLPNLFWAWTQKDGYRASCNVIDVKADPLMLNSGNYLQYLTGFGDFGTALDTYTRLHTAYQRTNYQRSESFDLPDVGDDASNVLWPLVGASRLDWMASRKPIYRMLIPDTSATGAAIIGQRIRLRHKRYTSGLWVYGTLVEWALDPMAAQYSVTIMGDPVTLDPAEGILYEDTIDPTASVPLWEDQTDGTSPLYEDQIGA